MSDSPIYNEVIANRRIGQFSLSRDMLEYASAQQCQQLFSHFIIVRAEYMMLSNRIEYQAYSHLFDSVPPAIIVPVYEIMITQEDDDTWIVEAERVD